MRKALGAVTTDRVSYRHDIQGLRAVAVLGVIVSHLGLPLGTGGFVGVDVFFVISGFVIFRKLLAEVEATGGIRVLRFWAQRAKRLMPNALLVLATTLAAAFVLLPGYRLAAIGNDVVSAALFASNIRFADLQVDYFHRLDPPSLVQHFWSLSVEEQFYLALPLALISLCFVIPAAKRRSPATILLGLIVAASFLIEQQTLRGSQPAAFFLMHCRAWQFAIGALLALREADLSRLPDGLRRIGSYLGALAILFAISTYTSETPYPGLHSVVPTVGALLLLGAPAGANGRSRLTAALSTAPMRWIGDRSYSLYLWHWPMLALAEQRFGGGPLALTAALLVALVAAELSYEYVERPIHRASSLWPNRRLCYAMAACPALVVAAGAGLGLAPPPADAAGRNAAIAEASRDLSQIYADHCHLDVYVTQQPPCIYGDATSPRTVVLFGDSHAAEWFPAIAAAATQEHWKLQSWTKTSCPPAEVSIWYPGEKRYYRECDIWRKSILDRLVADPPNLVILGEYSGYSGWIKSPDGDGPIMTDTAADAIVTAGLQQTIRALVATGTKIVLMRDNPSTFPGYKDCLAWQDNCPLDRSEALSGVDATLAISRQFPSVRLMDLADDICGPTVCPAKKDGLIVYQDQTHLTAAFSATLAPAFVSLLSGS